MWAVYVVIEQANIALVVENLSIMKAISRGWEVVRNNIGNMIVMSLILILGVGLIGGAVIGLPLLIVATPAMVGICLRHHRCNPQWNDHFWRILFRLPATTALVQWYSKSIHHFRVDAYLSAPDHQACTVNDRGT